MAKEWGYASHNGESPTAARAPGTAQTAGPGQLPKPRWRVGWGHCPAPNRPLPSSRQLPAALSLPGGRAGSLPKTAAFQEPDLAGPALSSPSPGQAGTHLSARCRDRAGSDHHLWPDFLSKAAGGGPEATAPSSLRRVPGARAGCAGSRCRRSPPVRAGGPGCHPSPWAAPLC